LIFFPFRYLWWLLSSLRRSIGRAPDYVIFVLESSLPALPDPPGPFWQRFVSQPRLSVKELGERFDAIAHDPRTKGVVLHLRPVPMSMACLQDLRELVSTMRAAGKRVVAWAPFYTTGTYYLACACDEILLMPAGLVRPLGFASTGVFLAEGLARVGIKADFIQISPYKSAADPLTKSKMSPQVREQLTWLLDSNHKELVAAIAASRHAAERWRRLVEDGYGRLDVSAARLGLDAEPQMARVVEGGRRRHHEGVVMSTVSVVVTGTAAGGRKVVPDAE